MVDVIICAAGDIHGALDRLFEDVLAFEEALRVRFEWVLHVGDFGVWPDPHRIDKATRKHDGAGDFLAWWSERRAAPRRTMFIKGNHEDFVWLDAQPKPEVLPNLFYLRNGETFDLGGIVVGGLGGCHGPSNYERRSKDLQGYAKRHYTREDIDMLLGRQRTDMLLTHDAPAGVVFPRHRRGFNWASEAVGLDDLVRGTRPRVCFFSSKEDPAAKRRECERARQAAKRLSNCRGNQGPRYGACVERYHKAERRAWHICR